MVTTGKVIALRPGTVPSEPLYRLLATELRVRIEGGVLPPGSRMPSLRAMGAAEGLSINTVQEAYRLLEDDGLIVARPQSGYFVRACGDRASSPPANVAAACLIRRSIPPDDHCSRLAYREDLIPFGAAVPHDSYFPCRRLAAEVARILRLRPQVVGQYAFAPGSADLRRQVSRHAGDWAARVDPERVVITNGAVEAVTLCLRAVTKPGQTVAVESPAYYGFLQTLHALRLRPLPIRSSEHGGMDVQALAAAAEAQSIAAVLLCPTVSNPSGATMSHARKAHLVSWAEQRSVPVIEDATFADLHFEGDRLAAQGLSVSGIVMLCASLSKTVAPGLRLGWVDAGRFSEQVAYLKRLSSIGQPQLLELALASYMSNGGMARHLRRIRRQMRDQVYRMAELSNRLFPAGTRIGLPSGGFLLWIELPPDVDALALQERAVPLGLGVAPGPLFSPTGAYRNFIRLNCGVRDGEAVRDGLKALAGLVREAVAPVTRCPQASNPSASEGT